jgi:hypothetical protein
MTTALELGKEMVRKDQLVIKLGFRRCLAGHAMLTGHESEQLNEQRREAAFAQNQGE